MQWQHEQNKQVLFYDTLEENTSDPEPKVDRGLGPGGAAVTVWSQRGGVMARCCSIKHWAYSCNICKACLSNQESVLGNSRWVTRGLKKAAQTVNVTVRAICHI